MKNQITAKRKKKKKKPYACAGKKKGCIITALPYCLKKAA